MTKSLAILLTLALSACATPNNTGAGTVKTETFPHSLKRIDAIQRLVAAFASSGYVVRSADKELGIVTLQDKDFTVKRGMMGIAWPVKQNVTVTVSDSQAVAQISYQCNFGSVGNATGYWAGCDAGDADVNEQKVPLEAALRAKISEALR